MLADLGIFAVTGFPLTDETFTLLTTDQTDALLVHLDTNPGERVDHLYGLLERTGIPVMIVDDEDVRWGQEQTREDKSQQLALQLRSLLAHHVRRRVG